MAENETSKCVLQNVKSIIEETCGKIADVATNRTHQMVKVYNDKTFGVKILLFGLPPFDTEIYFTITGRIEKVIWK